MPLACASTRCSPPAPRRRPSNLVSNVGARHQMRGFHARHQARSGRWLQPEEIAPITGIFPCSMYFRDARTAGQRRSMENAAVPGKYYPEGKLEHPRRAPAIFPKGRASRYRQADAAATSLLTPRPQGFVMVRSGAGACHISGTSVCATSLRATRRMQVLQSLRMKKV